MSRLSMTAAGAAMALAPVERAAGMPLGGQVGMARLPPALLGVRDALERAVLGALARQPCTVSFSGGRDSSAVLALATHVARKHGLDPPIPLTLRFPSALRTHESQWQELVVAHLGLRKWERIEIADELDVLGDLACAGLLEHGLLWPANAHLHVPLFAHAAGGSLLTGIDGDGLLSGHWSAVRARLTQPGPVAGRDALSAGLALCPARVRAARYRSRPGFVMGWLRSQTRRRVESLHANERASEPLRWDRRVEWYARRRHLHVGTHSLGLLAARHEVLVCHPLLDRGFLASLAACGGRGGLGNRDAAMRSLFADLLPPAILARAGKAEFGAVFWGPRARAFAASWDGSGVEEDLVDREALRAVWSQVNPPLQTATLMHQAWLARANARRAPARAPAAGR
jgi:asparagine synthase (glutamine-hydrolysing)